MKSKSILARNSGVLCCVAASCLLSGAEDPFLAGKRALAEGHYQEAERLLEKVRDSSRGCQASFYLGLTRYRLKQLERAIIDLQSASQCDTGNAEPRVALAVAYADRGDDDRALAAFESALEIKPDHVDALRAAAALELRHERNGQAISKLEKLVAIEPHDAQARSDLGAAYAAVGNYEKAREHLQYALKLRPKNPSALVGLGNINLKTGHTEQALALLTLAAEADPQAYEPRFLRAAAYNSLGRYADAAAECTAAVRLGGKDPEIYYHLAKAYRGLGREEDSRKALAQFSALRAQSNGTLQARREAARLLEQAKPLVDTGRLSDAIALLESACQIDHGNAQVLFRLAGLYYDRKSYDAARRYAADAIAIAPSEWLYHYLLGLIEKDSEKLDAARKSLATAIRLNPSAADAFNQLGDLAMRRQDLTEAVGHFEKAIQLNPQEAAYQLNLQAAQRRIAESKQ